MAPILPPIIEGFSLRYPKIILDIYEEEFATFAGKLRSRSLDFVLQRLHGRPKSGDSAFEDLDIETLFEDELVIAVGRRNAFSRRRRVDLADLLQEPWILASPPSWNHRVIAEACQLRGVPMPKIVLSTFSTHIRASMVSSGRFVAIFPRSVAQFYARRFDLKILKVELPQPPWPAAILTLRNRTMAPAAHLFLDHVRKVIPAIYRKRPNLLM